MLQLKKKKVKTGEKGHRELNILSYSTKTKIKHKVGLCDLLCTFMLAKVLEINEMICNVY